MIHEDATGNDLELWRVIVFSTWLVYFALNPVEDLAALPSEYFDPVGPLRFFSSAWLAALDTWPMLAGLRIFTMVSAACCLHKRLRVWAELPFLATLLILLSFVRGFTHVNHQDLALFYVTCVFVAFDLIDLFSQDRSRPSAPLATAVFVFLFTYTLAGLSRLSHGLPLFGTAMSLNFLLNTRPPYTSMDVVIPLWVLSGGVVAITIVEILAPLVLFFRRFSLLLIIVLIGFHVVSWLALNILFWGNLVLTLLLIEHPTRRMGDIKRLLKNSSRSAESAPRS